MKPFFKSIFLPLVSIMFNPTFLETKIKESPWWERACQTIDNHHSNNSGIMLSDHLHAVYKNIEAIFNRPATGFYADMFALIPFLSLDKNEVKEELKLVALLHDIGKPLENKKLVIPHPLTGKPAHKRHGLVGLMAAMDIIGQELTYLPEKRNRIYRTIELHDMSYGLFREFVATGVTPKNEQWNYINDKVHTISGAGLLYLLFFKLADIHGHEEVDDVIWFYKSVKAQYFDLLHLYLPIPVEADMR
jgi:HD domain